MDSVAIVRKALDRVDLGAVQRHGGLSVFALLADRHDEAWTAAPYLPLAEALDQDLVEIEEVSEAGSVPTLRARNRADQAVFLLDGEELVGAKQNRVVNVSVLLPPKSTIDIPVSCVEAGRWAPRTARFHSEGRTLYAGARVNKAATVSYSLAVGQAFRSDQSAVWNDIDAKAIRLRVDSPTAAMADIYHSYAERLAGYRKAFPVQDGQIGALFAIGNTLLGTDVFGAPRLLEAYLPSIVEGYALDAIEQEDTGEAPTEADARAFVRHAGAARFSQHEAVGLGEHLRIREPGLAGGALVHEDALVHLAGFRIERDDDVARTPRRSIRFTRP